jgi:hypothetical protein
MLKTPSNPVFEKPTSVLGVSNISTVPTATTTLKIFNFRFDKKQN